MQTDAGSTIDNSMTLITKIQDGGAHKYFRSETGHLFLLTFHLLIAVSLLSSGPQDVTIWVDFSIRVAKTPSNPVLVSTFCTVKRTDGLTDGQISCSTCYAR